MDIQLIPAVVAHRGNARDFPENTLASLTSAIELGVRYVEFDVHLSADEVPIVIHDDTLIRTAGRPESVFDLNAYDLTQIAAGERSRFEDKFSEVRIPSLQQVGELIAAHPRVTAFVELKRASLRRFGHRTVVARVIDVLKSVRAQCVLISYDLAAVHEARDAGAAAIGWVLEQYDERSKFKFEALKPDYLFCDQDDLPNGGSRLWRGPWRWAIYEVESADQALALAARGVELVETMAVAAMLAELAARRTGGGGQ
jgi:glycerophosphoryl diester phosphodiesterase